MKIDPKIKKNLKNYLLKTNPDVIKGEKEQIHVVSAGKLDQDEVDMIRKKFNDLNWEKAVFEIDSSILAGIILKFGSRQIDLSLSGSLSKLFDRLYEID